MKKLLVLLLLAGLGYGAWKYMEKVNSTAASRSESMKPSEKALKEEMKAQ